ncbi:CGNR zinc finger domain-containing protein [Paenibacillus sp. 1P07SE]|uniref:CGNR zinc finger domain-containing protein n=1 Tax=Paenibacillus sp. 1P07SE TaxID=3132209 RepID=UPI0039A4BC5D
MDVINSNRVDWRDSKIQRDMLDDEQWIRDFLCKWELTATLPMNADNLKKLKRLRDLMRTICIALNADLALQQDQLHEINLMLTSVSSQFQLNASKNAFEMEQMYNAEDWTLVLWQTTYSFAQLLSKPDVNRLKVCDNQNCEWIFLDQSKNQTRRWCDTKVCGNIMKVRRFRNRKKEQND